MLDSLTKNIIKNISEIIVQLRQAFFVTIIIALLLGGLIPLFFTISANILFPSAAKGSLIYSADNDKPLGSELIGQEFTKENYFWGRMSATTPPYNAAASGASNLSMGNNLLLEKANLRMEKIPFGEKISSGAKIPLSLVTSSASGIDPHISVKSAHFQASRVAKARNIPLKSVSELIEEQTQKPFIGIIGNEYVNVLKLNLALDEIDSKSEHSKSKYLSKQNRRKEKL